MTIKEVNSALKDLTRAKRDAAKLRVKLRALTTRVNDLAKTVGQFDF